MIFNGATKSEPIAGDSFDDDFNSCIDKPFKGLDGEFKDNTVLNVN